jgi:hypothetical protein
MLFGVEYGLKTESKYNYFLLGGYSTDVGRLGNRRSRHEQQTAPVAKRFFKQSEWADT